MNTEICGIYREETFLLPRGRIAAVVTPDGAQTRLELFTSGLVAVRPMRDFAQALRCARAVARQHGGAA